MMTDKKYQIAVQLEINELSKLTGKKAFQVASSQAALAFVWEQFEDEARIEDTVDCLYLVFSSQL
tara:strand:+ start:276 stop:470 length:195 start_codon:yes stop_codon:yes gene_type:complete